MAAFLKQLVVACILSSVTLSSTCPETTNDCSCAVTNDLVEVTCIFSDAIITAPVINTSVNENSSIHIDVLDLSSNNLTALPQSFFINISSVRLLQLQNNSFSEVPEPIKDIGSITELDISRNNIKELDFSLFHSSGVRSLHCAFNEVNKISFGESFEMMEFVNISHNKISLVPEKLWTISQVLDLSFNRIRQLSQLPKSGLSYLYLNNNQLTSLAPHTFKFSNELNELHLTSNKISKLFDEAFNGLDLITELYLDGNMLTDLKKGVFKDLKFLVTLSLSSNKFSTLQPEIFLGLGETLQQLRLSHNNLAHLHSNTFESLDNLRMLDLSFNSGITDINHLTLKSHIASLDLKNCSLREIRNCKFMQLTDLQNLDLSGNNFKCTCHLSLLYSWYKDRTRHGYSLRPVNHNSWTCTDDASEVMNVNDNIEFCGRYQDMEPFCKDILVIDDSPIKIKMNMTTSVNLITARWEVTGNMANVFGFVVIYKSNDEVLFQSPILDKSQNSFIISFVEEQNRYSVCVEALANETFPLISSCKSVYAQSIEYLVGIMAGVVLLIPFIGALTYIVHKDRIIRRRQYAALSDGEVQDKDAPKCEVVVVVASESTHNKLQVEKHATPYHENKAFSADEASQTDIPHHTKTPDSPSDTQGSSEVNGVDSAPPSAENTKL